MTAPDDNAPGNDEVMKDLERAGKVERETTAAEDGPAERRSAATQLVGIATALYDFGISDAGETYAIPKEGPRVLFMLRGGKSSLRAQLSRKFFTRTGKAAPQQALADALLVIEGMAQEEPESRLYLRVARHDGALWLDLGDQSGRVVKINADGWSIENNAPVYFKRTSLNGPLPEPVRGGSLDELWHWLNVEEDDRPLVVAWLVAALRPDMPHPVIDLSGEQGSGKTTAAKALIQTIDPGPVPVRKPPRDAESWVTAAAGSWVVGLDNMTTISDWLSDSLCRAVTGEGDVRRKLYTDGDLAVFAFRRCIVITGIDLGAVNGDLTDRLLPMGLAIIPEQNRLEEDELWPRWTDAHPRILGALLDLAASVEGVFSSVRLERKPRMADFARVVACVDRILGTKGLSRYVTRQGEIASESLTGDLFITAMAERISDTFEGTSADLLGLVTPTDEKWRTPKHWPANARQVTQLLHRQAPVMRKAGWEISEDDGKNKQGVIRWAVSRPEMARNPSLPNPPSPPRGETAGQAGQAGHEYESSQDGGDQAGEAEVLDLHGGGAVDSRNPNRAEGG